MIKIALISFACTLAVCAIVFVFGVFMPAVFSEAAHDDEQENPDLFI